MSHEIFGDRFYGHRFPAWHGLGIVTPYAVSGQEALTMLGGGYEFLKTPAYVLLDGEFIKTGDFNITRTPTSDDPNHKFFGYVKSGYQILQPLEIVTLFDENVGEPVETLGMLGSGERLFLTWKLDGFNVGDNDRINLNAFLAVGYDGKTGASLNVVAERVVCSNTWKMAMSEAEYRKNQKNGTGRVWRGRHNSPNIHRDLGIWMGHLQEQTEKDSKIIQEQFEALVNTPITKDEANLLLPGIYKDPTPLPKSYPARLRESAQLKIDTKQRYIERDRELVMELFDGGHGTAIDATAWGLFNSITEYENWGRMTKKAPEYSILNGERSNTMNMAMHVLYDYATVEE